jgi:hypothetical protein
LGVFAQDYYLPEIAAIGIAGRGVATHTGFGHDKDYCAKESEGVFTWVGNLRYEGGSANPGGNGIKWYVSGEIPSAATDDYQLLSAVQQDEEIQDGGVYNVAYVARANAPAYTDYKWRLKYGEDGYYKLTLDVLDPTAITMSVKKVDVTYANLGSLAVDGFALFQKDDEENIGFDPDVYEYNCYISEDNTPLDVSYFAFLKTRVTFNGESTPGSLPVEGTTYSAGGPYVYPVTVSGGDASMIGVTGFDNSTTNFYTINYINESNSGINSKLVSKVSYSVKDQALTVTGTDAYVVYSVDGIVAADVRSNAPGKTVSLLPGVYIVKANKAEAFKIVVK